jgi:nucleoid DNA-binding protein
MAEFGMNTATVFVSVRADFSKKDIEAALDCLNAIIAGAVYDDSATTEKCRVSISDNFSKKDAEAALDFLNAIIEEAIYDD